MLKKEEDSFIVLHWSVYAFWFLCRVKMNYPYGTSWPGRIWFTTGPTYWWYSFIPISLCYNRDVRDKPGRTWTTKSGPHKHGYTWGKREFPGCISSPFVTYFIVSRAIYFSFSFLYLSLCLYFSFSSSLIVVYSPVPSFLFSFVLYHLTLFSIQTPKTCGRGFVISRFGGREPICFVYTWNMAITM